MVMRQGNLKEITWPCKISNCMLSTHTNLFLWCAHLYDHPYLKDPFFWHSLSLPPERSRCVWRQGVLNGILCHKTGSDSVLRETAQLWWKTLRRSADSEEGALVDGQAAGSPMKSPFTFSFPHHSLLHLAEQWQHRVPHFQTKEQSLKEMFREMAQLRTFQLIKLFWRERNGANIGSPWKDAFPPPFGIRSFTISNDHLSCFKR